MVRLAPSASNRQPWRIIKENGSPIFHFYIQRSKAYQRSMKMGGMPDLQLVDMGIAMTHFELSANEKSLSGKWIQNDPEIELPENIEYILTWQGK